MTAIFSLALCVALLSPGECWSTPAIRSVCNYNLAHIREALQSYEASQKKLPPAYTTDSDGNRVHSWRTLLLPYMEQSTVYRRCQLKEPWNSPHNNFLADINLPFFHCPSDTGFKEGDTSYVAVVGRGTAWRPGRGISLRAIKDRAHTILLVELKNSGIKWAEPRDLDLKDLPPSMTTKSFAAYLSGHPGGFNALFADWSVRFVPDSVSWDDLQAMFTIAGGEVVDPSHL
jgi:prepilin-type processing-associated H-X9-DG protein